MTSLIEREHQLRDKWAGMLTSFNPETIENRHNFVARQSYLKGLIDAVRFIEQDRVDCLVALKKHEEQEEEDVKKEKREAGKRERKMPRNPFRDQAKRERR